MTACDVPGEERFRARPGFGTPSSQGTKHAAHPLLAPSSDLPLTTRAGRPSARVSPWILRQLRSGKSLRLKGRSSAGGGNGRTRTSSPTGLVPPRGGGHALRSAFGSQPDSIPKPKVAAPRVARGQLGQITGGPPVPRFVHKRCAQASSPIPDPYGQWITRKRLGEALTRPDTPSNSLNRKARGCSNAATPGLRTTHQAAPNGVVDGNWASIPQKDSTIPPHFATFLVRFGSLRLDI